jgi:hypothetical protein
MVRLSPDADVSLPGRLRAAMEKLGKWRGLYAGWWFGTRRLDEAQARAARDNFDRTIMLRCEVNAFTALCLQKGLWSVGEWQQQLLEEIERMDAALEEKWPGFRTDSTGLIMTPAIAHDTMKREGFPE